MVNFLYCVQKLILSHADVTAEKYDIYKSINSEATTDYFSTIQRH